MRIKINFTKNTQPISIDDSCEILNSYIHRCFGEDNPYHDSYSPYSISSMQGGTLSDGNLNFENGMHIIVSIPDGNKHIFADLLKGILSGVEIGYGMKFINVEPLNLTVNKNFDWVQTICPIILREKKTNKYLVYTDDSFLEELTNRTIKKLKHYDENIDLTNFSISIVDKYNKNKIKKIKVKESVNKCSMLRLKITGSPSTRKILYEHGLGSSTGSGFGALKPLNT